MPISETGRTSVDLEEASRQLEQAAHDAQIAYDSLSLGNLDWAHTSAIIARAEADAAENLLRAALRASQDGANVRCTSDAGPVPGLPEPRLRDELAAPATMTRRACPQRYPSTS
jgi:hypothetical protein